MANTRFQLKRSTVSGVSPTTSDIAIGELGINVNDRKLFSSNGSAVFEIGANVSSIYVGNASVYATINSTAFSGAANSATYLGNSSGTIANVASWITGNSATAYTNATTFASNATNISSGTLADARLSSAVVNTSGAFTISGVHTHDASVILNNDRNLNFQTVNTSAYVGFRQQSDDNFVFYSTNTIGGQRAIFAVYANSVTSNLNILAPLQLASGLVANGSLGSAGQVLTTSGTGVYWSTSAGGGGGSSGFEQTFLLMGA